MIEIVQAAAITVLLRFLQKTGLAQFSAGRKTWSFQLAFFLSDWLEEESLFADAKSSLLRLGYPY